MFRAFPSPCRLNLDEPRWRRKNGDKFIKPVNVSAHDHIVRYIVNFFQRARRLYGADKRASAKYKKYS